VGPNRKVDVMSTIILFLRQDLKCRISFFFGTEGVYKKEKTRGRTELAALQAAAPVVAKCFFLGGVYISLCN
jgi:hypothetical protein